MRYTFAGWCLVTRAAVILGTLGTIAVVGVAQQPPVKAAPLRGGIDSVPSPEFAEYLRSQTFSPDTETGDRQALLVGHYPESARYGPLATVFPELNSYEGSLGDLRRGKVIAKIVNESALPYPKLGLLPHGTTYWWVQYDSTTGRGRSVFVAVDTVKHTIVERTVRGLEVKVYHQMYRVTEARARFVWDNDDETLWGTCNGACCHSLK